MSEWQPVLHCTEARKFWFRLEPRFDFDHSEIAPLSIRLFESGEVSRNSGRCKWTLCRLSAAFALLLTRCIWRTESFRVEQPPARNHPHGFNPGDVWGASRARQLGAILRCYAR